MIYFKEEEFLSSCACHVVIGKEDQQRKRSEKKKKLQKILLLRRIVEFSGFQISTGSDFAKIFFCEEKILAKNCTGKAKRATVAFIYPPRF